MVADFGTTVYEAWALGKPVIFPPGWSADRIAEHMPGSAESLIFEQRIGYHPDSFDEMIDMVRARPVITPDVSAFMDDYPRAQYFGRSSARVAQVLTEIAARETVADAALPRTQAAQDSVRSARFSPVRTCSRTSSRAVSLSLAGMTCHWARPVVVRSTIWSTAWT